MFETTECYGVFTRLLGLTFAFQLGTTGHQLLPLIGRNGVEPIEYLISAFRRDHGVLRGFLKLPSLFWLSTSDTMIRAMSVLGTLTGLGLFFGLFEDLSPLAFLVCWAIWLTFINSNSNVFGIPWDNLLLEAGLLAILLPGNIAANSLSLQSTPHPFVHFLILFLSFRVMFGMGLNKFKVIDHRTRDGSFIYHFLEWQPFGTKESLYVHALPMPFHRLLLVGLFISEVVMPWAMFLGPEGRLAFALSTMGLQVGIYLCGNFGVFNLMPLVLAVPFFADMPLVWEVQADAMTLLCGLHFVGSLPYLFLLNSWNQGLWAYVPKRIRDFSPALAAIAAMYRLLAPLRIWCAYGIFTPRHNYPKLFPVIQMSDDGEHWRDVQTKYLRYKPSETSWHWAPYHPRLDHYFYYTHFRAGDFKVSCLSGINPYYVHQIGFTEKLVEHLYRGNPLVQSLFENIPIAKPQYIRLATYGFKLEIPSHFKKTGNFWKRQLMGATKPLQRLDLDASTGIHPTYQPFILILSSEMMKGVHSMRSIRSVIDAARAAGCKRGTRRYSRVPALQISKS